MLEMISNDYKSMEGFWKKLSLEEKQKFVRENVDKSMLPSSGLVYLGIKKGSNNKSSEHSNEELSRVNSAVRKMINYSEKPAIFFD